jgi:hypothetical protein
MLKRLLFETRVGELLLTLLERTTGLAVVDANWLGHRPATAPTPAGEMYPSHRSPA